MLSKVSTEIWAFLLGFAVCLFKFPCTGSPYIFALSLLAEKTTELVAIPLLLLYNLFFISPLMLLACMILIGHTTIRKASEWKSRNIRTLHLVTGVFMIVLGGITSIGLI